MTAEEAQAYHAVQIGTFADTEADLVTAITMTYADEAIGIARAAQAEDLPVVISFTAETDGRLPTGETLGEAIEAVDAATGSASRRTTWSTAHTRPTSSTRLDPEAGWTQRIRGVRANASRLSHAELDEAEELDSGDPRELAQDYLDAVRRSCRSWRCSAAAAVRRTSTSPRSARRSRPASPPEVEVARGGRGGSCGSALLVGAVEVVARVVQRAERDHVALEEQRQRPVEDDPHLLVEASASGSCGRSGA